MRVSINVTNYSWPGGVRGLPDALADIALRAEANQLDTVWVSDHLLQVAPGAAPDQRDMLEAYTTLGFLAASTTTIRLGTLVTGVTYRAPALLLKAVTTLDALSRGRAWLGVGAGYPGEAAALNLPMPPTRQRFTLLEELLRAAGYPPAEPTTHDPDPDARPGLAATVRDWAPQPRNGRVPLLIGGVGEQHTLRLVARYADACNLFDIPDGGRTLRHKLHVLDEHCRRLGRDPASIQRTVSTRLEPGERAANLARRLHAHADLGLDHAVVITPGPWQPTAIDVLGEAVAAVNAP